MPRQYRSLLRAKGSNPNAGISLAAQKNTYIGDADAALVIGDSESILGRLGGVDEGEVLLVGPLGGSVLVHV